MTYCLASSPVLPERSPVERGAGVELKSSQPLLSYNNTKIPNIVFFSERHSLRNSFTGVPVLPSDPRRATNKPFLATSDQVVGAGAGTASKGIAVAGLAAKFYGDLLWAEWPWSGDFVAELGIL